MLINGTVRRENEKESCGHCSFIWEKNTRWALWKLVSLLSIVSHVYELCGPSRLVIVTFCIVFYCFSFPEGQWAEPVGYLKIATIEYRYCVHVWAPERHGPFSGIGRDGSREWKDDHQLRMLLVGKKMCLSAQKRRHEHKNLHKSMS